MAVSPESAMKELSSILVRCFSCRTCHTGFNHYVHGCPMYENFSNFAYSGGGIIQMAKSIADGIIELSPEVNDVISYCTTCNFCTENCYSVLYLNTPFFDISGLVELLRSHLVNKGVIQEGVKSSGEWIGKEYNPFMEKHDDRLNWLPKQIKLPKQAEMLYFVGCTSSYKQQGIARATAEVLTKLGVDFTVSKDEWCCTSPLLRSGQWETDWVSAPDIAQHNIEVAREVGAKRILTICADCYRVWKKDYTDTYAELLSSEKASEFEILHVTELLKELIDENKLKFAKKLNMTVTYHDPCNLGRRMKLYETPREVLKAIPGIKLVEMPRNRELAWCCGTGGGVKFGRPEYSLNVAQSRIKEAEELGVDAIVSASTCCTMNLSDAITASNSKLKIYDIVELVNQTIT